MTTTEATFGADSRAYENTDVVLAVDTAPLPTSNVVGAVKNATFLQHVVIKLVLLLSISAYELSRPPVANRNAQYACQVVRGVSCVSVKGTETVTVDMTKFIRAVELNTDPIIATRQTIMQECKD